MTEHKIKVLLGKPGLDGHSIGLQIVARSFRNAGFEVVYAGILLRPSQIANAALQEDVDIIGISTLSGAHMSLVPKILELLKLKGISDVPLILGGIVPKEDVSQLKAIGLNEYFGPGTPPTDIVEYVKKLLEQKTELSNQTKLNASKA